MSGRPVIHKVICRWGLVDDPKDWRAVKTTSELGSVPNVVEKGISISYPIGKPTNKKGRIYRWRKDTTRDRN